MATKPPLTLGEMIATARKAKPWSLQQLGDAVGTVREGGKAVSPQFINDVEHDRRKPSAELLHAFAKILHLDIDVLHCATGEGFPSRQRLSAGAPADGARDCSPLSAYQGEEVQRLGETHCDHRGGMRGERDWSQATH